MTVIYVRLAYAEVNWTNEEFHVKYRSLFDRIYKSKKPINKLYNLIYLLSKILIVIAFVLQIDLLGRLVILAFPILFIIHDII